jgi:putative transposase
MSPFDLKIHHRRSICLPGYDYSQAGAYYVTIVTWRRDCLFGEVMNGEMRLSPFGQIADECWRTIPEHFPNVELGAHIIMPNHAHGIIVIREDTLHNLGVGAKHCVAPNVSGTSQKGPKPGSLGAIIGAYKSAVSYQINKQFNAIGIWQHNYHEHIIREGGEITIEGNPILWNEDDENPHKTGAESNV